MGLDVTILAVFVLLALGTWTFYYFRLKRFKPTKGTPPAGKGSGTPQTGKGLPRPPVQ